MFRAAIALLLLAVPASAAGVDVASGAAALRAKTRVWEKFQNSRDFVGGKRAQAAEAHRESWAKYDEKAVASRNVWNVEGRLTGITNTAAATVTNASYDAMGLRRSEQTSSGASTTVRNYTWAGGNGESEVANDDERVVTVAGLVIAQGTKRFSHDGLGSVIGAVDSTNAGVGITQQYGVFGTYAPGSSATPPSWARHTNHLYQEQTLVYGQQRWQDTVTGTWLSQDPLAGSLENPNSLATWGYGAGSPMRFTDPDGRRAPLVFEAVDISTWKYMASTREEKFSARPEWQKTLYGLLGSTERRDIDVLQRNIRLRSAAIARAADGEPVNAVDGPLGVSEDRDVGGFSLQTKGEWMTGSEARRASEAAIGEAVSFSPISAAGYNAADTLGASEETKNKIANVGAVVWTAALPFAGLSSVREANSNAALPMRLGSQPQSMRGAPLEALPRRVPIVDVTAQFRVQRPGDGYVHLTYGDPENFHGLKVSVDAQGVAGFDLRAGGDADVLGSGTDMMLSAMKRLRQEGVAVNKMRGFWIKGTDSVNAAEYRRNIESGMTPKAAAAETWTGRFAGRSGYPTVERVDEFGGATTVIFGPKE